MIIKSVKSAVICKIIEQRLEECKKYLVGSCPVDEIGEKFKVALWKWEEENIVDFLCHHPL